MKNIYNLLTNKCSFYKQFIDDIFLLWNGTLEELEVFLEQLNQIHPSIKFDAKFSKSSIEFLDTKVYKATDGKLHTTLYTKPTDRQSYLHSKSYHPSSCKRSIAYSQALRIKRICSEPSEFEKHVKNLSSKLAERGYKPEVLEEQIEKARKINRNTLLEPTIHQPTTKTILAVTYNKKLPNLKKAINNNWDILSLNQEIASLFQEKPVLAFPRNRNPKNILC